MMTKLEIKGTDKSPKFILEGSTGSIKILGRSTMVNPHEFYGSILSEIKKYALYPANKTHLLIDLEYYNTLSSRYLLNILKIISRINHLPKKEAKIIWYFDEEDYAIQEDIQLFSKITSFNIQSVAYEYY